MRRQVFRIGKNSRGWYLAIPQGWGGFHVLEGLGSFEQAVAMFNHVNRTWSDNWRWM